MPDDTLCKEHFSSEGLPHRKALLNREHSSFTALLPRLFGRGRGAVLQEQTLTVGLLRNCLKSDDPSHPWIGAYIIGRCRAIDTESDTLLTQALKQSIDSPDPEAILLVEVGMSLLLRGNKKKGLNLLHQVLDDENMFGKQYKAAYYLAQTGDPSGYPQLVAASKAASNHSRIMAVRHGISFLPYSGQVISGITVDVRTLLIEGLRDKQPIVRREVPLFLAELGISDLKEVLAPFAESDPDKSVRIAIQSVIGG